MNGERKTPRRRFKEFQNDREWEMHKLGNESIEIVAGGDIDRSKIRNYGKYPVVANALVNDGIVGYYNNDFRIEAPAVTVTGRGDVGCAKARKINFTPVVRLLSVKSKHNVDFLEHAINNCNVIVESTGVPQLTVPQLSNYEFYFPKTIDEENSIGKFFGKIDDVIKIHQRKLEKLKAFKKAYLTQMFPSEGESKPKLRFAGFKDEWEQYKLEDMCSIITKQTGFDYSSTIKPSLVTEYAADTYSFIQNKDFEGTNINLNTDFYIPINIAERFPQITLDKPSLLISISGRIGNVGLFSLSDKAFIGGAVGICKLKNIEDGKTALYELLSPSGQYYFQSLIKASSHANITVEDIRKLEVFLPKHIEEKEKINNYFEKLDNIITLHQRKLEKLQNLKKAYLNEMFV